MQKLKVSRLIYLRVVLLVLYRCKGFSTRAGLDLLAYSSMFHNAIPSDFATELDSIANQQFQLFESITKKLKADFDKKKEVKLPNALNELAKEEYNKNKEVIALTSREKEIHDFKIELELPPVKIKREDLREFPEEFQVPYLGKAYNYDPESCYFQLIEDGILIDVPENVPA